VAEVYKLQGVGDAGPSITLISYNKGGQDRSEVRHSF
jgi:hypothetical protein